ncbi:hypothetical protein HOC01_05385 [archaeon]|jgi:hypothetical protein|nr:hypothetical protein [archaeon]MBT6697727.1 hypothetical protein [archaeon]
MAARKKVQKKKASKKPIKRSRVVKKPVRRASSSKRKVARTKKVSKAKVSKVSRSKLSKKAGSSQIMSGSFYWKFPREDFQLLRIEIAVLVLLSGLVFLYMYLQPELNGFIAVVSVILFLAIYFVVSAILRKLRRVEELYELGRTHLDIQRYVNGKRSERHKIALKDVKFHKFDHTFHGAYVVLHDGTRHPLFFSSSAESRHVERKLKAHMRN